MTCWECANFGKPECKHKVCFNNVPNVITDCVVYKKATQEELIMLKKLKRKFNKKEDEEFDRRFPGSRKESQKHAREFARKLNSKTVKLEMEKERLEHLRNPTLLDLYH